MNRLKTRILAGLGFAFVFGIGMVHAHPDHGGSQGAPWYRYLPPGAPQPAPTAPR